MMDTGLVKVLLVEDDEDDFVITRDLLSEIPGRPFTLDWVKTFEAGLESMCLNRHDVVLVDYRLGAHNGIELLRAGSERGCQAPVILLTGRGRAPGGCGGDAGRGGGLPGQGQSAGRFPRTRASGTLPNANAPPRWLPSNRRAWPRSAPRSAWP